MTENKPTPEPETVPEPEPVPQQTRRGHGSRTSGVRSLPRRLALKALWVYQMGISPLKPAPTCRFEPVCSAYAIDAVTEYGAVRGSLMALIRLTKCGPWHPGGWDPVRPREKTRGGCVDKRETDGPKMPVD